MNGLRIGTPELVRWGMTSKDAPRLASLIKRGLDGEAIADEVGQWRRSFNQLHFRVRVIGLEVLRVLLCRIKALA